MTPTPPMVVAIRGPATRQATIALDERGVRELAEAIEYAEARGRAGTAIDRLGRQLRGFLEAWDSRPPAEDA